MTAPNKNADYEPVVTEFRTHDDHETSLWHWIRNVRGDDDDDDADEDDDDNAILAWAR